MNPLRRHVRAATTLALLWVLLSLAACDTGPMVPIGSQAVLQATPAQPGTSCEACAQATLAAALTQEKFGAENQAAATAEIVRANAQATLNSANATLGAAQTQSQNDANAIAAQIAATAEIVRANAQATYSSAASTQSAALTQDAIRQTQMADEATTSAQAFLNQQSLDQVAAGTQTAVANNIATQTQVAADQTSQRNEERQGPIAFLWMWCLPAFLVILAVLVVWGFWRWLKIQQSNQQILEQPVDRLPAPAVEVRRHRRSDVRPYLEGDVDDERSQLTEPDDQVQGWLDEVKRQVRSSDEKEDDDGTAH